MRLFIQAALVSLATAAAIMRRDECPDSCLEPASKCCVRHLVVAGDTCQKVADQYHMPLDEFYNQNPTLDRNNCPNLQLGCYYCIYWCGLLVPGQCPDLNPGCVKSRPVVQGDTCLSLLNQDSNRLNRFFDLNPRVERPGCGNLQLGCQYCLKLPPVGTCTSPDTCPGGHLSEPVKSGQTCCELIGMDGSCSGSAKLNKFYDLNQSVSRDNCPNLQENQRYCIPDTW